MKKGEAVKKLRKFGFMALWVISGMFGGDPAQMLDARAPEPDEPTSEDERTS